MNNPISIRLQSPEEIKSTSLGSLQGTQLQREVRNKAKFINSLINGKHRHLLDYQGYMLMINGSWGTGKTVTTNALINYLKDRSPGSLIDICTDSFLPFGNVNESISNFLNEFAIKLWEQNIVDIRKDIQQFVLEATPAYETNSQVSFSAGPLSASRTWTKNNKVRESHDRLYQKLGSLTKKGKTVLLVVDDLDRLAPSEILAVLRMVEKVRRLPRVIIMVPVFKKILADALRQELALSNLGASHNFLRKLTDAEIKLAYGINDIKQVFIGEFQDYKDVAIGEGYPKLPEFCWYSLLHSIILGEALDLVKTQSTNGIEVSTTLRDIVENKSPYIASLIEKINESGNDSSDQHYPTRTHTTDHDQLGRLSKIYEWLPSYPNSTSISNIEDLTRAKRLFNDILLGKGAHDALLQTDTVNWDKSYKTNSDRHFFQVIALPLLRHTKNERLFTENYGMRDIKVMARDIQQHRYLKFEHLTPQLIYVIVSKVFEEIRF